MDINKQIEGLDPYFLSLATHVMEDGESKIITLEMVFPENWLVETSCENVKFSVKERDVDDTHLIKYLFASDFKDTDNLFKVVNEVIEKNVDILHRQNLFEEKKAELEKMFKCQDMTLDMLSSIKFTYKKPRGRRSKKTSLNGDYGVYAKVCGADGSVKDDNTETDE